MRTGYTQGHIMPVSTKPSPLARSITALPRRHDNTYPLWRGPCGEGPLGGITQSMLVRFLSCRERFRLKYVLGLEPYDKWNHRLGYGNMWHVCEEYFAKDQRGLCGVWQEKLREYAAEQATKYRMQAEEIEKWWNVCRVQFPEYVAYWQDHPDVKNRTPLMQEQVFDVLYNLPSGRVVRLRGKFDSVDLIVDEVTGPGGGIYLQEDKTKWVVDKMRVERQLKFDLQTMLYLIALADVLEELGSVDATVTSCDPFYSNILLDNVEYKGVKINKVPMSGVRYNVVRRPLSGGVGNIKPHGAKSTKNTYTPAETMDEFYERLRRDYIAADPGYWFFRVRSEVSAQDIEVFRKTCLDPLLETVCSWYDEVTGDRLSRCNYDPPMNYRTPFGVYSALEDDGATEYDAYLETGSEAGLRRVETLFPELQDADS